MKPQITVGLVEFGTVVAYVLIFTVLWRTAAAKLSDTAVGKGMAAIYT